MPKNNNDRLTPKEEELMQFLWEYGPISISKLVELYPAPKPHFNTLSTVVRRLEAKGFVAHNNVEGVFHYFAKVEKEYFRNRSFSSFIKTILEVVTTALFPLLWRRIRYRQMN